MGAPRVVGQVELRAHESHDVSADLGKNSGVTAQAVGVLCIPSGVSQTAVAGSADQRPHGQDRALVSGFHGRLDIHGENQRHAVSVSQGVLHGRKNIHAGRIIGISQICHDSTRPGLSNGRRAHRLVPDKIGGIVFRGGGFTRRRNRDETNKG